MPEGFGGGVGEVGRIDFGEATISPLPLVALLEVLFLIN